MGVIGNASTNYNANVEEEEFLTSDSMAAWLNDNKVLQVRLEAIGCIKISFPNPLNL